jgi:hypothetical protein
MNHQLRRLDQLANELGIDSGWLLTKTECGRLPAMQFPGLDRDPHWFFHRDATANAIAAMIQRDFSRRLIVSAQRENAAFDAHGGNKDE